MHSPDIRYDVLVVGARVAGAALALRLAHHGLRVLLVDRTQAGKDALSTHAMMRGAMVALEALGLFASVEALEAPRIDRTTLEYAGTETVIPIKPRGAFGGLRAPRRAALDAVLVAEACAAGVHVAHGVALTGLERDARGRVRGARLLDSHGETHVVTARIVVGADGIASRVAELVEAETRLRTPHATAVLYTYYGGLPNEGYRWCYAPGVSTGAIPTNGGLSNVFVAMPPARFAAGKHHADALFEAVLGEASPALARALRGAPRRSALRRFAGAPGHLRACAGRGWALVGDAACFRDPITAHGMSDALREAILLADAIAVGDDAALARYAAERDMRVRPLLELTDRIASLAWTMDELETLHRALTNEVGALARMLELHVTRDALDGAPTPDAPVARSHAVQNAS